MGSAAGLAAAGGIAGGVGQLGSGLVGFFAARENAKLLRRQGQAAYKQGQRQLRSVLGAQRAGYGAAGVFGVSPTLVQVDTATQLELLALREKWRFDAAAENEKLAGTVGLVNSLFGGVATALGSSVNVQNPIQRTPVQQQYPRVTLDDALKIPGAGYATGGSVIG